MYFVTTKKAPYTLFAMTQSERFAVGVTDQKTVHLLSRDAAGNWSTVKEWDGAKFSHTDFMAALHRRDEPADTAGFLQILPADLR